MRKDFTVRWGLLLILTMTWAFGVMLLQRGILPENVRVSYETKRLSQREGTLPLKFEPNTDDAFSVWITMRLPRRYPHLFQVFGDDCINELIVNGRQVNGVPFCNFETGDTVDLSSHLHAGVNTMFARGNNTNGPGSVNIRVAHTDPTYLIFLAALSIALLIPFLAITALWKRLRSDSILWGVLCLGAFVRFNYMLMTPHWLRSYDSDGHVDYIQYLLTNLALPPPHGGWQFYHPPLYYFCAALWVTITETVFGVAHTVFTENLQIFSLVLSVGSLGVCVWLSGILFEESKERMDRALFLLLMAVFPGFVFFASRINNDLLLILFSFLSTGFLLRFWKNGHKREALIAMCFAALALLTKTNALVLAGVILACIALRPGTSRKQKIGIFSSCVLLLLLMTGWFFGPRFMDERNGKTFIVGNITSLDSTLLVPNTATALTVFNPVGVISHPFNHSRDDAERRQYFPEFFYKSAFFGEFMFATHLRPIAQSLLLLGMVSLILIVIGAIWTVRRCNDAVPLLLLTCGSLVAHSAYRILSPYSSIQDFRYSIILMIPLAAFAVRGARSLSEPWRSLASSLLLALAFASTVFLFALFTA